MNLCCSVLVTASELMGPLLLRDSFVFPGVRSAGHCMAAGKDDQLIFKISRKSLKYYDLKSIFDTTLEICNFDPVYHDAQILALSFLQDGNLLIVLQRESTDELVFCVGVIDLEKEIVDVSGPVHRTNILNRGRRKVALLQDEEGVVLISYPICWKNERNVVELYHVSEFLRSSKGEKYKIELQTKDKLTDVVFENPFISRNHLYLFFATDSSKFALIPLTGNKFGKCEIRATSGVAPRPDYLSKQLIVFDDFVLIYAHISRQGLNPNLYVLNLTNLKWYPLNLELSHHFPAGKVRFEKADEDIVYLHGDCNIHSCAEKCHLYQIKVDSISALIMSRTQNKLPETMPLTDLPLAVRRPSQLYIESYSCPPLPDAVNMSVASKVADSPIHRYKKRVENKNNRYSNGKDMKMEDDKFNEQPLKKSSSCSSLHWGSDMAEQNGSSVHAQMKQALEMGYPAQVVSAAFTNEDYNDVKPFENMNRMLDVLQRVSGRGSSESTRFKPLSIYDDKSMNGNHYKTLSGQPRSASVSRSSSFAGSHQPRYESDLTRIINALDREKERDKNEFEQHFAILKQKIIDLEKTLESTREEKNRLFKSDQEKAKTILDNCDKLTSLVSESAVQLEQIDKLTIAKLKLERDLESQKELAEHRKEQFQTLRRDKEKDEEELKRDLEELRKDLELKKSLLDEQTSITRRLEDQRNNLQAGVLLEKIAETSSIILQKKEEHATFQRQLLENSIKHEKEEQLELGKIQDLYKQVASQLLSMEQEHEKKLVEKQKMIENLEQKTFSMNRKITELLEKTLTECCICLSTKPNVVFQPCRHLVVCSGCSQESSLKECPTCRTHIEDVLNVYS
ncbi:unnamed protein product [Auanema sp. JU1783]|nr:unnamed protein product [Auanema sp. JU1783]